MPSHEETHWTQLEELFHEALDLPAAERDAFVAERTRGDDELRRELENLIASHTEVAKEFLLPDVDRLSTHGDDLSGRTIGGHELLRLIAFGGMGAVYEAEQERPKRRVALKVLRNALSAPSAQRRFEFEAELLARLEHPSVARIYEAGIHPGSPPVPYFVMELVEGALDLATYCDEHGLATRQRVELFLEVCAAVEHGHQRGVLHRDIKPGNVLVDGEGRAKVIDFGVARAKSTDVHETLSASPGEIVGTLAYMSPEQTLGGAELVDVRCDVYALGGVLYRLLTGAPPHDIEGLTVTQAIRAVQERPLRAPSSLAPELRGELETILLGALEKERDERYPTVNALASDLGRWLRSEPILRSPTSPWRRARLFVRRNKKAVAVAAVISLSLITGAVTSLVFGISAQRAAAKERVAFGHSDRVAKFLERILSAVAPFSDLGREATALDVLNEARAIAEVDYVGEPFVEAEIRGILGSSFYAMGQFEEALAQFERMEELWAEHGEHRPEFAAEKRIEFARLLMETNPTDPRMDALVDTAEAALGPPREGSPGTLLVDEIRFQIEGKRGHYDAAIEGGLKVAAGLSDVFGAQHVEVLEVKSELCYLYMRAYRAHEGVALAQELFDTWTELRGPKHPRTLIDQRFLADLLFMLGRNEESLTHLDVVMDEVSEAFGPGHPNELMTKNQRGRVRIYVGRIDEARQDFAEVLEAGMRIPPLRDHVLANVNNSLGRLELMVGNFEASADHAEQSAEAFAAVYGPDNYRAWKERVSAAYARAWAGDLDRAESDLRAAREKLVEFAGEDAEPVLGATARLGEILMLAERFDEAAAAFRESADGYETATGAEHPTTVDARANEAVATFLAGRGAEALAIAERVERVAREAWDAESLNAAHAAAAIGLCRDDAAGLAAMRTAYDRTVETFGAGNPGARRLADWIARTYERQGETSEARTWRERR